jgi:eukaryotic-like serine/threonine-protein kinase
MSGGGERSRSPSSDGDEPETLAIGRAPRRGRRMRSEPGTMVSPRFAFGLRAGRRITPNIELVRELGSGGMGCVWLAHHEGLDIDVAVKFIGPVAGKRAQARVRRLAREAKLAARVRSQHVVAVYDTGVTDDGVAYIVMERLEGETLADQLAREGQLSVDEVVRLVRHVAAALSVAHERGVVHRDIKPANLFLTRSGERVTAKVLDFGLAKPTRLGAETNITRAGQLPGTPQYMSPEQLRRGRPADAMSDLWALAVVAYECLTGGLPFEGGVAAGLELVPARKRRPGLPPAIDEWLARALAADPKARFASANHMAASLLVGLEAKAPVARGRRPVALLFVLVLVVAAAVVAFLWTRS